jgi:hypothetical protein
MTTTLSASTRPSLLSLRRRHGATKLDNPAKRVDARIDTTKQLAMGTCSDADRVHAETYAVVLV